MPFSSPDPELVVRAEDVSLAYSGHRVLEGVSVAVRAREIVTLVGLNGAGKSTLVRVLLGLEKPDTGRVWRRPGLRVGYTPQHILRDPVLPLKVRHFLTLAGPVADGVLLALLRELGASDILDRPLAAVSGGELHRVLLARALLGEPDLLVLDEPMAGVDVSAQAELYQLIARIRDRTGCGVLLVSHDLHLVMAATDTVLCLNRHVCCTGHPHAVARDPRFVALFGEQVARSLAIYTHHHDHAHDASGLEIPLAPQPSARGTGTDGP